MKLFFLSLVLLTSSAFAQWNVHFSTQLSSKLTISGISCNGKDAECAEGQWFVTVDTYNTCTQEGLCTELFVPAFVAELVRVPMITIPESAYYEIVPVSSVPASTTKILKKYYLLDRMNGTAQIVKRK